MKKYRNLIHPKAETKLLIGIFLAFLIVRVSFVLLSGYDSFELQPDSLRYDRQSDGILAGNFNLVEPLFITAPLYPYFEALFKFVFGALWTPALQISQILISSLTGIFLYKIAKLTWNRLDIALIAAAMYCFFPPTFWWVHTFSQETLFQCLVIFSIYYLLKGVYNDNFFALIISAVLFSAAFLTKSHLLLFSPFIPVFIFLAGHIRLKNRFFYSFVFAAICLLATVPYGLYNLKENGSYVISSTGLGGHFVISHNDDAYLIVVTPPAKGTPEHQRLVRMDLLILRELEDKKQSLSQSEIQDLYLAAGIQWCKENPRKALTLAAYNLYRFIMPGFHLAWYPFTQWLVALVISTPVYILGYSGIIMALKQDLRKHIWIVGLFFSVLIFSVGFYVQNRFRTVTIEPFYILYGAFAASYVLNRASQKYRAWTASLERDQTLVAN